MGAPPKKQSLAKASRSIAIRPSIYLEYGLDGLCGDDTVCELCARGMRLNTRWQFEHFSVLHVAFSFEDNGPRRVEVEAMVVQAEAQPKGGYVVLLSFINPPPELQRNIGKIAARLLPPTE